MISVSLKGMAWMDKAACKGANPDLFFPKYKEHDTRTAPGYREARVICKECPVIKECLHYSIKAFPRADDSYGMWGGMSPKERRVHARNLRNHRIS